MSSFDIQLLLTALVSVLVLVVLIVSRIRMHPLLALLVVSIGVGFATGMDPTAIVKNLTNGAGKTLGAVGVVIALAAMRGKIMADSGTTEQADRATCSKTASPCPVTASPTTPSPRSSYSAWHPLNCRVRC